MPRKLNLLLQIFRITSGTGIYRQNKLKQLGAWKQVEIHSSLRIVVYDGKLSFSCFEHVPCF